MSIVHWRGSRFDARTHAMLKEAERIGGVRIEPTQGSYNTSVSASAGTHSGGGAVDIRTKHLHPGDRTRLLVALRAVGFAAWYRTQAQGFSVEHIHAIAVGCTDLAPAAADQVRQYLAGRDGLKQRGPDTGPRDFPGGPGTTWETYQQSQEGDDMTPEQAKQLANIDHLIYTALVPAITEMRAQVQQILAAVKDDG